MIEYPLASLVEAGVDDVILVLGGKRPGDFIDLLKNGKSHGLNRLYYTYQEGEGGIADALKLAEPFIEKGDDGEVIEDCVVILGDNYFEESLAPFIQDFHNKRGHSPSASILLKQVPDPERFGVAEMIASTGQIVSIVEKPVVPVSDLAILGCYIFDGNVWDWIWDLKASARGELEITDLLNKYLDHQGLSHSMYTGHWSDMGTFDSLLAVSNRVLKGKAACL